MIEIGRICVKIAGRDAGHRCVIIEKIDDNFVMIDGDVRRKRCNIAHLEPLTEVIKIKKGESHSSIVSEFKKMGIEIVEKKSKPATQRPRTIRKSLKPAAPKKAAKEEKKETKVAKKEAVKKAKK